MEPSGEAAEMASELGESLVYQLTPIATSATKEETTMPERIVLVGLGGIGSGGRSTPR